MKYKCPTCGATKEIRDPFNHAKGQFPKRVICGWRGCPDYAERTM